MLKAETEMFDKFDLQSLIKSNQMSVLSMSLCVCSIQLSFRRIGEFALKHENMMIMKP